MSFAMVLAKYRQKKRPMKSRKTTKKEYSKRKKSVNSTPQKNQIRSHEEDSKKSKYKTYKIQVKIKIKKVQYNHRKLRGKKEEHSQGVKPKQYTEVELKPNNYFSDQKSRTMSVNMCIFDVCDASPVFSWQKTNVLVKHLVTFHELDHEAAREAAMKYQVENKASGEVIKRLKELDIVKLCGGNNQTFCEEGDPLDETFKPKDSSTQESTSKRKHSDTPTGVSPEHKVKVTELKRADDVGGKGENSKEILLVEENDDFDMSDIHGEEYSPSQTGRLQRMEAMKQLLSRCESTNPHQVNNGDDSISLLSQDKSLPDEQSSIMNEEDEARKKMEAENEVIKDLEGKVEKLQKSIDVYHDLNAKKNSEKAKLEREIEIMKEEMEGVNKLKKEKEALGEKVKALTEENREWEKTCTDLSAKLQDHVENPGRIREEDILRKDLQKTKEKLKIEEDLKCKAQKAAKDTQALCDKLQDTLAEGNKELNQLREKVSKFNSEKCEDPDCKHPKNCGKTHAGKKSDKHCPKFLRGQCIFGKQCWDIHDDDYKKKWRAEEQQKKLENAKKAANEEKGDKSSKSKKEAEKEKPSNSSKKEETWTNPPIAPPASQVPPPTGILPPNTYSQYVQGLDPQVPLYPQTPYVNNYNYGLPNIINPPPGFQGNPFPQAGPRWPGVGQMGPWSSSQNSQNHNGQYQGRLHPQGPPPSTSANSSHSETDFNRLGNIQMDNVSQSATITGVERELQELKEKYAAEMDEVMKKRGIGEGKGMRKH